MDNSPDYTLLDDPALLAARARPRAELDEATARYQELTDELDRRARAAWAQASEARARAAGRGAPAAGQRCQRGR
jgi:hypothetical protein